MEGVYENKTHIFIVMEKLSGGELFERIGNLNSLIGKCLFR